MKQDTELNEVVRRTDPQKGRWPQESKAEDEMAGLRGARNEMDGRGGRARNRGERSKHVESDGAKGHLGT